MVVIDETADMADAAEKISVSKVNDWASGCSAENSIVIQESIYNNMIAELEKHGGYLCSGQEKERLEKTMWPEGHRLNREIVAKPASVIAELAGISLPEGKQFLMVEEDKTGEDANFSHEKLSVVLTVYRYLEFELSLIHI